MRVPATGKWSLEIGPEFELIDNGDSVQAVHEDRVVYVSSIFIGTAEAGVPVAQLRAATAKRLGSGERVSHLEQAHQGDAEVTPDDAGWRLQGTMCADGTVATCVIQFRDRAEQDWAISVWSSLRWDD